MGNVVKLAYTYPNHLQQYDEALSSIVMATSEGICSLFEMSLDEYQHAIGQEDMLALTDYHLSSARWGASSLGQQEKPTSFRQFDACFVMANGFVVILM